MNNHKLLKKVFAVLLLTIATSLSTQAQESEYEFLRNTLSAAKGFTIQVFKAMPAEDYSFKPTEDVRTFAAQAYHIAYSIEWFHNQLKGSPIQWSPGDENSMTKEELIKYVEEQFDAMNSTILESEFSGQFTDGILGALRHNSHHRGQMVTYLRTKGIKPPSYN